MAKAAYSMREMAARRPAARLMEPSDLPRRERGPRRVDEVLVRCKQTHAEQRHPLVVCICNDS